MSDFPFSFAVPGLDALITGQSPIQKSASKATWSAAIVGPDGCGKSILGLHLCSAYRSTTNKESEVAVIYVSTDLSYEQAAGQWESFGLSRPNERKDAIAHAYSGIPDGYRKKDRITIKPVQLCIGDDRGKDGILVEAFIRTSKDIKSTLANRIHFIDLQKDTAGDDWGYLNQLIGLLPERKSDGSNKKHLMIIDAVEGLETFVGVTDAFGQRRTRRSRVAQLLRCGTRSGVHIVFVVEEPRRNARLPEQFVTDLVLRLYERDEGDYRQRVIEIEKCRAFAHARGKLEFSIRPGSGTFTGNHAHIDDPLIKWEHSPEGLKHLAHIHVTPSVHRVLKQIREEPMRITELKGFPSFGKGLESLNDLFGA